MSYVQYDPQTRILRLCEAIDRNMGRVAYWRERNQRSKNGYESLYTKRQEDLAWRRADMFAGILADLTGFDV